MTFNCARWYDTEANLFTCFRWTFFTSPEFPGCNTRMFTRVTFVRLYTLVPHHVHFQWWRRRTLKFTQLTLIIQNTFKMRLSMTFEFPSRNTPAVTIFTFVWLCSIVPNFVPLQFWWRWRPKCTFVTFIWFSFSVCTHDVEPPNFPGSFCGAATQFTFVGVSPVCLLSWVEMVV